MDKERIVGPWYLSNSCDLKNAAKVNKNIEQDHTLNAEHLSKKQCGFVEIKWFGCVPPWNAQLLI